MTDPANSFSLPADTGIASADLQVADLERSLEFYAGRMGLRVIERQGQRARLSANGSPPYLLGLSDLPSAIPQPAGTTGLYHIAIRLPDRPALAQLFRRLLEQQVRFQGAADHGVSEALYLADPEGNGLELYVDKPRQVWPWNGGQIAMTSDALDIRDLLQQAPGEVSSWQGIHPDTAIGHIHLKVSDLTSTERFYHGMLGFQVTQRNYPGALFFSAGGYHHHLGTNIWESRGGSAPPANATGLISYTIAIPDGEAFQSLARRMAASSATNEGAQMALGEDSISLRDPSSIQVILAPVPSQAR